VSKTAAQNPSAPSPISFLIFNVQALNQPFSSGSLPIEFERVPANLITDCFVHPFG